MIRFASTAAALLCAIALLTTAASAERGFPEFSQAENYGLGGLTPEELEVADLDGDGRPEVIVPGGFSNAELAVLSSDRGGALTETGRYPVGESPEDVAVADLDRDGDPDVVTSNVFDRRSTQEFGSLTVLLNDGRGGLDPSSDSPIATNSPDEIQIADVDRDGRKDLLSLTLVGEPYGLTLFQGRGDGTFADERLFRKAVGGTFEVARLNSDRLPDIVSLDQPDAASILVGTGKRERPFRRLDERAVVRTGNFEGEGGAPFAVAVADFDRDGRRDIATLNVEEPPPSDGDNSRDADLSILLGRGDGRFRKPQVYALGSPTGGLTAADLNADGRVDLAVTHSGDTPEEDQYIQLLRGRGDGSFARAGRRELPESSFGAVAAALDAGRSLDLAVASTSFETAVSVLLNSRR